MPVTKIGQVVIKFQIASLILSGLKEMMNVCIKRR